MLNSRAIAVQGIGFSTLLIAAQGLLPVEITGGSGGIFRFKAPKSRATGLSLTQQNDDILLMVCSALSVLYRTR